MTNVGTTTWGAPATRRGRLVAALLVVALILCHGALGALHESSSRAVEHGGHHGPSSTDGPTAAAHHDEHHDDPMAHSDYAAVLFVVLLGTALALFSRRFLARGLVAPRVFGRVPASLSLPPPRGPTPTLLQVFRL